MAVKNTYKRFIIYIVASVVVVTAYFLSSFFKNKNAANEINPPDSLFSEPLMEYGIETDSFAVYKAVVSPNEFLSHILTRYNVPYANIDKLTKTSESIFDVRKIASGKKYTVFCTRDSLQRAICFIYEPNEVDYVVFDMRDSLHVYKNSKPVEKIIKTSYGKITSSLYEALANTPQGNMLAAELANIYAWTIDFYRLQKNDWFKIVFEENTVEGKPVGINKILACEFYHYGKTFYAFNFSFENSNEFYNEKGESLRKAFLKSPLKFSRITSGFSMSRFHPVQKRNKPHLGTDYGAPQGTPILATGDGIVQEAAFKQYNGNYVKIKHNSTYSTQYLHMSKIAKGIKQGVTIKQGDVIGFVGSTGLASGPHVCYRFWKNGKQINHLKEDFPNTKPVPEKYKNTFMLLKDSLLPKLDSIYTDMPI
ncbi:MAG: peptidoglycan DD-metalloendopeptidase family protein [Flavobacteriales bacterium]|nr:peptidoglycan DD-metalloendopeptidase family protein [Flavobacteriales bacterium]